MLKKTIAVMDGNGGRKNISEWNYDPKVHTLWDAVDRASDLTRESLKKMKKADVVELLEQHGLEVDKSAPVSDLREQADSVVFVGDIIPAETSGAVPMTDDERHVLADEEAGRVLEPFEEDEEDLLS